MNAIQASKTATKTVVRKTRQPKTAVRISAIFVGLLTFVAQQSTETGSALSMLVPFEYKDELTLIGTIATVILGLLGEYLPNRPTETK